MKNALQLLNKSWIYLRLASELSTLGFTTVLNAVSPLHVNLQVANFQRRQCVCQSLYASCCSVLCGWVPKLTLLDLEQIGLTKALSKQKSFTCRGLAVKACEWMHGYLQDHLFPLLFFFWVIQSSSAFWSKTKARDHNIMMIILKK